MKKHKWIYSALLTALCVGAHAQDDDDFTESIDYEKVNPWTEGSYLGSIDVTLKVRKEIKARIETDDLILRSVTWDQFDNYVELFGDPSAVEKYADGEPWTIDEVHDMMCIWIKRWEDQKDPFSAFAVYLKSEDNPFIGHIVLGHGTRCGQAELAYLFKPEFQNRSYGKQAVTAILYGYAARLIEDNYLVNMGSDDCSPTPLRVVHATARLDNLSSTQILHSVGMKQGVTEILWGASRMHYMIDADEILSNKFLREYSFDDTE
jgi:RimJ/RimL family protein N-acetyltransferase